jgi:signal transduction histidine kinase
MGNLIDDLLAFSRVGRAETKGTLMSLEQLVSEAVAELAPETKGRDIAWKLTRFLSVTEIVPCSS